MTDRPPVVIDLDDAGDLTDRVVRPDTAAPVPDLLPGPADPAAPGAGGAVAEAARLAARPMGRVARLFWAALGGFIVTALGIAAWDFVAGLLARSPTLGWVAAGLGGAAILALLVLAGRELAALARLRRLDSLRAQAEALLSEAGTLTQARTFGTRLRGLYQGRPDLGWALVEVSDRSGDVMDAPVYLAHLERTLLAPLDAQAAQAVEAASRQVAVTTALVPLALADVAVALAANLRMIRQIAEIYGGRAGTLGAWRLARAVAAHLVATGAVAIGEDLLGSVFGGKVLARLSRRFGEGLINGALTARVGVAAMEVCRPMPFTAAPAPRVTALVRRAVVGLVPGV